MLESVLITGGNAGVGRETARQLAIAGVERVLLGCRNLDKAAAAVAALEAETGRSVFGVVRMDLCDLESVRAAVSDLEEPVQGVVLNAGGLGGASGGALITAGATRDFATNVLGHAVLLEELVAAGKVRDVVVHSGAEAARGIPMLRMQRPALRSSTVEEFASIADGSWFGDAFDPTRSFILSKYIAALWIGACARRHEGLRFVTMSPGGTTGSAMTDTPAAMRLVARAMQRVMQAMGRFHDMETGAKRYVRALTDPGLGGGRFYGSPWPGLTGDVVDQAEIFADIGDAAFQDAAAEAILRLVRR